MKFAAACWMSLVSVLPVWGDSRVMVVEGGVRREIGGVPDINIICSPEISPDEKWVAVDGWNSEKESTTAHVYLIDITGQGMRDLGLGCMPSWSSDGQKIAYCKYGQGVFVREVESGAEQCLDQRGWGIQWSPDGKWLAYVQMSERRLQYDQIVLVPADQLQNLEQRVRVFADDPLPFDQILHNMSWSPSAEKICVMAWNGQQREPEIAIVTVQGETRGAVQPCGSAIPYDPDIAWHPNGWQIALTRKAGIQPGRIELFYVQDPHGERVAVAGQSPEHHSSGACWSRDGKRLYYIQR